MIGLSRCMNTYYLVRHAHNDYTNDEDRPLSERGLRDAERLANILSGMPVDMIFSSPYRRARQTIEPLASRLNLPIQPAPELRERRLGDIASEDFFAAVEATWADQSFSHPGGEANTAAKHRGICILRRLDLEYDRRSIVLSTHGNLMALILRHFDPAIDYAFWKSLTMPDIYRLKNSQDGGLEIRRLWRDGNCRQ